MYKATGKTVHQQLCDSASSIKLSFQAAVLGSFSHLFPVVGNQLHNRIVSRTLSPFSLDSCLDKTI